MDVSRMIRVAVTVVIAAGITALIVRQFDTPGPKSAVPPAPPSMASMDQADDGLVKPQLAGLALEGKAQFQSKCAVCHGGWGGGTDKGPPLIHNYYNPGHHADMAIVMALRNGVRQHHWKFGNMPAQPQVKFEAAQAIIAFIRNVQVANGIK